ncbi:MAG: TonB-dependent receptor [Henriciella sp.]
MRRNGSLLKAASAVAILAAMSAQAVAQESGDGEETEARQDTVVVQGIRGALTEAVNFKRNADTIGEAISADDIGTLPALDLAEALQVVPGVQVNRENDDGAFRYGEISLRGLPGAFTQTTANGQTFSSPSGSVTPAEGVPNAFGAFASSVFDGVWVNKTARADLVEGGIAGTVDKRLAKALSKPDGQFLARIGAQYEELPDDTVGTYFVAGTKHFIPDRLAVTFKLAHEEESFRRDAFNFTSYQPMRQDNRDRGGFIGPNTTFDEFGDIDDLETIDEWKASLGIDAEDTVIYPNAFRQYSESRDGFRTSFVGGVEFQATNALKLGADILYSNRELDFDSVWILPSVSPAISNYTPTSDPFFGYENDDGSTTWVVSSYDYEDIIYAQSTRSIGQLTQETEGIFLNAEYDLDHWTLDASLAFSEGEFNRDGGLFNAQYFASSVRNQNVTNGTFGSINTGAGNSDNYLFTLNFDPMITTVGTDLDLDFPSTTDPTASQIRVTGPNGQRTAYVSTGNEVFRGRTDEAFNFNAEREMDFGLITSVKFGGRYNEQSADSFIRLFSLAGQDTTGLSNDLFVPGPGADDFFGGNAPGALTTGEWEFIDSAAAEAFLYGSGFQNPDNNPREQSTGFVYRQDADGNLLRQLEEATTDTTITALYGLMNFEGELSGINVGGNFGLRYVETELEGRGFGTVNGEIEPVTASNEYSNLLPSFNLSLELKPDLYLRLAYSEGLNRPNPAGFTPSIRIDELDPSDAQDPEDLGRVVVALPGTGVDAYTSNNYDVSLEWYNRKGSVLSAAWYRKDVNSFIDQRAICPTDGGDIGFGTLTANDLGGGIIECRIDADGREIAITETYNFDTTITLEGIEIAAQQDLSFLDNWFLAGFGVQASAAFVDVSGEDPDGNDARVPRISDESYNIAGYWENETYSARLAYNWRSDYFLQGGLSITGAADRQVKPRGQLDFIGRYNFNDNLSFDFRVFNILEVEYEEYQSGNEAIVRQTAFDGRTFALSGIYKF